jgi:hypothetical protein
MFTRIKVQPISIVRGITEEKQYKFKNLDGTPFDLTGLFFVFGVKNAPEDAASIFEINGDTGTATEGILKIPFTITETDPSPFSEIDGVFEIAVYTGAGKTGDKAVWTVPEGVPFKLTDKIVV